MMNNTNKARVNDEIINKAKQFFRDTIAKNHVKNTERLSFIEEFNINPFLIKYLANFLCGNGNPTSIAKALIYPRVLGTSISTSFGSNFQRFINIALEGYGSTTTGIDIEFLDKVDKRKKYCQIKAGPNTINYDDVKTIQTHFRNAINLGRANGIPIANMDCVVGIFYGEKEEINAFYKSLAEDYMVLVGEDFWHHLTGDVNFYKKITDGIGEIANEFDCTELLENTINALSANLKDINDFKIG